MPSSSFSVLNHLPNKLAGLFLCLLGAWLWQSLRLPLPWMMGPLVVMSSAKMLGLPLHSFAFGRTAGQWVIGTALGLYFTPSVITHVLLHLPAIIVACVFSIAVGVLGAYFLRWAGKVDFETAFFSSTIGGAAEMVTFAEHHGGSSGHVAAAHALRILLVVLIVPTAFAALGVRGVDIYLAGDKIFSAVGLATLAVATGSMALLFKRLGWLNPWMMGPMLAAFALTGLDVHLSTLPPTLSMAGQLLIGWSLGDKFERGFFRQAPRWLSAVAVFTLSAIVLCALFAVALAYVTSWVYAHGIPAATAIIGTAPGGIAEMSISAKVWQLGVPLVTAFHSTRMMAVTVAAMPIYRFILKRFS